MKFARLKGDPGWCDRYASLTGVAAVNLSAKLYCHNVLFCSVKLGTVRF